MSNYPVKFGKYLLLERVNVGGMAEVFKAKTFGVAGFERILAIKRILPNLVEDDEFIRMFIDEARIAVQLNHANIVQIYELGKHGEHYYIAMEYVPSRDLRAILDRMRSNGQLMPITQAAYITKKVCEGLDYAHKKRDPQGNAMNIIHRDVSPQNILVGFEGEVKVIDFGIAKAANRASKTQAGVLKGKFGYMSPEQVRGLPTDRRSDIFAVGVLLYEMLTGERLFIGESDFSTLERVRNAEVIPPTNFNKKISPALEQIVLKTLAREVEDRFQWASDLAEELEPFLVEDKQVFNMKRLAVVLKETYAAEIALERQKLEEFLRITADDAKPERGGPAQSSILPLHHPVETDPAASAHTQQRGAAAAAPAESKSSEDAPVADDDGAGEWGEDKTFVIEASAAGVALQNQVTDEKPLPNAPTGPLSKPAASAAAAAAAATSSASGSGSGTMQRPTGGKPENTNDDFLDQVSLYGDDGSSEDDSRTLVSAPNPFFNGENKSDKTGEEDDDEIDASEMNDSNPPGRIEAPPGRKAPPPAPPTSRGRLPTAEELSDAPTMAAPSGTGKPVGPPPRETSARAAAPQKQVALDPVAAAMEEEERMAMEAIRGSTRGESAAAAAAPGLSRSNARSGGMNGDVAGMQLPVTGGTDALDTQQGSALDEDAIDDVDVAEPPSAPASLLAAIPPPMLRLLIAGGVAVAVMFVAVITVTVVMLKNHGTTQLTLYTVGETQLPADTQVVMDGEPVPTGLAAPIPLAKGSHKLSITGTGIVPIKRTVRAKGGNLRQPILLIASEEAAAPTHEEPGKDGNEPSGEKPAPPPATGGWRLSLAAVADDTGKRIDGAEVLVNGALYGRTPLEAEIDPSLDKVTVRIKKASYVAKEIPIAREGRDRVGPATVRLAPEDKSASAAKPDGKADEPGEKVAVVEKAPDKGSEKAADKAPEKAADKSAEKAAEKAPEKAPEKAATGNAGSTTGNNGGTATESRPKAPKVVATLQIGTQPYADVTIEGRKYGSTPFYNERKLSLPVGRHRIELLDKNANKKYKVEVNISAADADNKVVIKLTTGDIKVFGKVTAKMIN